MSARIWSDEQNAIFSWFEKGSVFFDLGSNHLVGRALAGSGKTTTLTEGVKRAPEAKKLICAFSKTIEIELQKRIVGMSGTTAKTFHALGFSCVNQFRDRIRVEDKDQKGERQQKLIDTVCGRSVPDVVMRLIGKLLEKGRLMAPHATKLGDLTAIAILFDCRPEESWEAAGYGLDYVETKTLEAMELAANVKSDDLIDFVDMIYLPVRNGWLAPQYDLVVVDETQDMTIAQLEIAHGVLKSGGRMALFGDEHQAIFSFIGADSGSLDRLKAELKAAELGLTTTYRCGRAIVELAQAYVPNFKAGPNNPDGIISELPMARLAGSAAAGDFILSRVNAPLVSIAMRLLRSGKRVKVAGKDIGKNLITLVKKLKGRSIPDLRAKIEAWANRENARHAAALAHATNGRRKALQAKMEAVLDQAEMLSSLTDGAPNVAEVESRIEDLFTDDGLGALGLITCSSVHRAKGLEARRVFVLRDTLRDTSDEERNIAYVAITRAKEELVWVSGKFEEAV